jgi:hypothetical protein
MLVFKILFLLFSLPAFSLDAAVCNRGFTKLEESIRNKAYKKHPILKLIEKEVKKGRKKNHELVFNGSEFIFKIGFLNREETRLLVLLYKAVEEGAIAKVDAGSVVGPKVLSMINSLRTRLKEKGSKLEIYGVFDYDKIVNSANDRMPFPDQRLKVGQTAYFWSEQEKRDYEKALKDLNVAECRKNFPQGYRNCLFHINIGSGKSTMKYSKP